MKLRFLCSAHRAQLVSDMEAAHKVWLRGFDNSHTFYDAGDWISAVNHAGCALEAAEVLLFTHQQYAQADIERFTDSAVRLCQALTRVGQPRLACGVIGGSIARLEELLISGIERATVLAGCQRLLTAADINEPGVSQHALHRAPEGSREPVKFTLQ